MTHLLPRGALAAALLLSPLTAAAQAVTDPNQIVGEVRFDVTNPAILDVLRPTGLGQGLVRTEATATSLVPPSLTHLTKGVPFPGGLSTSHDLTVESSLTGIPYRLGGEAWFDEERDRYALATSTTTPVFPDPAPDVDGSIVECLSMLEIRYMLSDGSPLRWEGGIVEAEIETSPGSSQLQAWNWGMRGDEWIEHLPVRGDERFRVRIEAYLTVGSDPAFDLVRVGLTCDRIVDAPCDAMVDITCVFGPGDCEGPAAWGEIVGRLDVLGEHEEPSSTVLAWDGPHGNQRLDHLEGDPSSGDYRLVNLHPLGEFTGWRMKADATLFRTSGDQRFELPEMGFGVNPRVYPPQGVVHDLGDLFVIDPAQVSGTVLLSGPPSATSLPMLADVMYGRDPVLRRRTVAPALGLDDPAPGATYSAVGGESDVPLTGVLDNAQRNWRGTYDYAIGGLNREAALWDASRIDVAFLDRSDPSQPDTWVHEQLTLGERAPAPLLAEPGSSHVQDRRYCVSEVHLGYRSTTGVFTRPNLQATGLLAGPDFRGELVDQQHHVAAIGTPTSDEPPSDRGQVSMVLPQGTWRIVPRVDSVSPRGAVSDTELPPIDFQVGCRQKVRLMSQLIPIMGTLPECVLDEHGIVEGGFQSVDDVVRLQWRLNGGPMTDLCTSCGVSPTFTFPVTWEACENELFVEAEDSEGRIASVTGYVVRDSAPPRVETDRMALWPPNHSSWCYEDASRFVRIADDCPGEPEWRITACRSSQPDDVEGSEDSPNAGDGTTTGDCLLSEDGRGFCVRAERLGGCTAGRRYSVAIRAVDGCGNVTETEIGIESPGSWSRSLDRFIVEPDARFRDGEPPFPLVPNPDPDAHLPVPFPCR